MELLNSARTWVIVAAVAILVIEVSVARSSAVAFHRRVSILVADLHLYIGPLLPPSKGHDLLLLVRPRRTVLDELIRCEKASIFVRLVFPRLNE